MNSWIVASELCPCQALPEIDMLLSLGVGRLSCQHPSMAALTISAHTNVSVQTEPQKQVAEEHSMVLRITAALDIKTMINIKAEMVRSKVRLTLDRKLCIECQTSTFSAPGASILWKGIRLTKRAA